MIQLADLLQILKCAAELLVGLFHGFLDLAAAQTGISRWCKINPCRKITRGSAFASLELSDILTHRTRMRINWGDRPVASAGKLDSQPPASPASIPRGSAPIARAMAP